MKLIPYGRLLLRTHYSVERVEKIIGEHGCHWHPIGWLFALSGLICWAGISQVIANTVTAAFKNAFAIPQAVTAGVLVLLCGMLRL